MDYNEWRRTHTRPAIIFNIDLFVMCVSTMNIISSDKDLAQFKIDVLDTLD